MAVRTVVPVPAASPGWVDDADASRGVVFKRNDAGSAWLRLDPAFAIDPDWEIVGIAVRFLGGTSEVPGLTDGPPNVGQVSRAYRAQLAQLTGNSSATYDGNGATFYGDPVAQSVHSAATVIHDLGTSMNVGRWTATWQGLPGASCEYDLSSSVDGQVWTTRSTATVGGTGANAALDVTFGTGVADRWWRFSVRQNSAPPCLLRIAEFQVYAPGALEGPI